MEHRISEFVVEGWTLDGHELSLSSHRGADAFTETITFPIAIEPTPAVGRILDLLAVVAGVSYAKACAPATLHHPSIALTGDGVEAVRAVYDEGLREFALTAGFGLPVPVTYPGEPTMVEGGPSTATGEDTAGVRTEAVDPLGSARPMIPLGAGRDSSLVTLALRHLDPLLVSIGHNRFADRVAGELGLELLTVERRIAPRLLELNAAGAPNGHVPVTAINSLISVVLAEHLGGLPVVMANERGASAPTRHVDGVAVNHQFSKSARFEVLLRRAIASTGSRVRYGSVLRDAPEQRIARAFALRGTPLHGAFMSCNRAMVRDPARRSDGWCGDCPKCRSVYLSLAPFLEPAAMAAIFGTDLLADTGQTDGFVDLVSADAKPFECVAEIAEARQAAAELIGLPAWSGHPGVVALAGELGRIEAGPDPAGPHDAAIHDRALHDTAGNAADGGAGLGEEGRLPAELYSLVERFLDV